MVTSADTVKEILEVVLRHVDKETAMVIISELKEIPGNQSFKDTIIRLEHAIKRRFP